MRAWHFTEMPYPDLPPLEDLPNTRVTLPSRLFDPKLGAELYNRYLDEHVIASELGLDMMLNEHHQSASCLDAAVPLPAAILARQTSRGRICVLGNPIANRSDPIRIAEEMAMVDCISRGRLDCGFVRGVPNEIHPSNANPTQTLDRLWDGIDLVVKAWTSHDGPFSYEGRFWHKRAVNVWPRPYQEPHPPIWITGSNDRENVKKVARRGYTFAMFLQPHEKVRAMFDAYRANYRANGVPGCGGLAYMPLVHTADSEAEAVAGAEALMWYVHASKSEPQFRNPPGYVPVALNVLALRGLFGSRSDGVKAQGLDWMREQGIVIAGTPDSVAAQLRRFYDRVGGFDHLLMMDHAGHLDARRTLRSLTLFAKEVYPRIRDLPGSELACAVKAAE